MGRSAWKRADGATMVEFALVTVMLVLVLLSVVEMGRMILVYTTMANAAKAGARYAMVHGSLRTGAGATGVNGPSSAGSYSQVQTVAQNYAAAGLLTGSNVNVLVSYPSHTGTYAGNYPGDKVDVTVSYTYNPLLGYFSSILNRTLSSTSEAVITF
jgi:Flp pilus assembly protein TadG